MKHLITAACAATVLLLAAGCSGPTAPAGPASYLAVGRSQVVFIHLGAVRNGHLGGTITQAGVGGSAPAQTVSTSSERFTGAVRGKSVTLAFAGLYYLHSHAHGTLNGNALTMSLPQPDGTIRRVGFSHSGRAGYDRAVHRLHSKVEHANLLAARAQARQHEGPANAQARRSSQTALAALYRASSLAPGGVLADGMARFDAHVHAARAHLVAEQKEQGDVPDGLRGCGNY